MCMCYRHANVKNQHHGSRKIVVLADFCDKFCQINDELITCMTVAAGFLKEKRSDFIIEKDMRDRYSEVPLVIQSKCLPFEHYIKYYCKGAFP